jgi:hypothetical protein
MIMPKATFEDTHFEEVYSTTLHAAKASGMQPLELAYYCNTYFNEENSNEDEENSMTVFGCTQVTITIKAKTS